LFSVVDLYLQASCGGLSGAIGIKVWEGWQHARNGGRIESSSRLPAPPCHQQLRFLKRFCDFAPNPRHLMDFLLHFYDDLPPHRCTSKALVKN
jgi:hypothetical protein